MAKLNVVLREPDVQEVARRAQLSGLPPSRWLGQVVESYLAGERCQHALRPEAPAAEEDQGEADG
jgi:hypothetical protein